MRARAAGFTIVELLVVMAIILVLAGLVLATSGYVHNKAARSRAEAEIAAMSAGLENYKADNGVYPNGQDTDSLNAQGTVDFGNYSKASLVLYNNLAGATGGSRSPALKSYFAFKDNMLSPAPPSTDSVTAIRDPFGNSYGYSTNLQSGGTTGYNPTFDLWSTAGSTNSAGQVGWVKNW